MGVNLDILNSITREHIWNEVGDNIYLACPFFFRMKQRNTLKIKGGSEVDVLFKYAKNTGGGSFAGLETLTLAETDNIMRGAVAWADYWKPILIDQKDIAKNNSDLAVLDLVRENSEDAENSLYEDLAGDLPLDGTGNTGKDMEGLSAWIDDGILTDTVAGLSRASYIWLKAKKLSNSGVTRALEKDLVRAGRTLSGGGKGVGRPKLGLCDLSMMDKWKSLFDEQQRYRDEELTKAGFTNLVWDGDCTMIEDANIGATDIWLLNESTFKLVINKNRNFEIEPFSKHPDKDAIWARIFVELNTVCNQPRANCRIMDVSSSL